jgi:hypothetical protein
MHAVSRRWVAALALMASALAFSWIAVTASHAQARTARSASATTDAGATPSITRFNLAGYVIDTRYTLGRNTGNTFQQTYTASTVHGVPVKGPNVGTTFPVEDYVAMPIGNHELYVAWLDTKTHALLDVYVMNLKTHVVFDYAPGSSHPESSGTITVVKAGATPAG